MWLGVVASLVSTHTEKSNGDLPVEEPGTWIISLKSDGHIISGISSHVDLRKSMLRCSKEKMRM